MFRKYFPFFPDMDIQETLFLLMTFIDEDMGKYIHCMVLYTYYI